MSFRKIKGLEPSTFLFSVICDRAHLQPKQEERGAIPDFRSTCDKRGKSELKAKQS
jgi:hypothetical protein